MNAASLYQDLVRTTASTAVGFVHSEVARGDTHSTLRNKLAGDCWGLLALLTNIKLIHLDHHPSR